MIEIRKLTEGTKDLLFSIEDRRFASERVVVRPKQSGFELSYRAMPGASGTVGETNSAGAASSSRASWRVGEAQRDIPWDYPAWLDGINKCVYFAWLDSELAGQILLEIHDHNLCRIRDIRVGVAHRRRGVGEAMITLSLDWARQRKLLGLFAETQDTNAGACQFFSKCGFQLGGVDMLRYAARSRETVQAPGLRESALFFYYLIR